MAKNVISSLTQEDTKMDEKTAPVATTQQEQDSAEEKAKAAALAAKAKELDVKLSSDPEGLKIGAKHYFYNHTKYQLRCPYSGATFPADNLSPSKIEVNEWIHSQVAAGLLSYQV